jgi:ribonuclease-3
LLAELPDDLRQQVFTHASWTDRRSDSYSRLAFLGDSVLGLSITAHLYPRLEAERYGAGRLTKIRAQAVSGRACKEVAEELGLTERLQAAAPASAPAAALTATERVLASVLEAVIGACYLAFGFERDLMGAGASAGQPEHGCAQPSGDCGRKRPPLRQSACHRGHAPSCYL